MHDENGCINPAQIKVVEVKPFQEHKLWLHFITGEKKVFDFKPLLSYPAFKPLANLKLFDNVRLDHGVTIWNGGEIDIDPSHLYNNAI